MKVFLPETLASLWELWEQNPGAEVYCGGTDLLVKLRGGTIQPPALICLERINTLRQIREEEDAVVIGAGGSHAAILRDSLIQRKFPVLVEALKVLGSPPIRNMGTLGGNLATASPAGDSLPALYVLDAEIILADAKETRILPIREFITGPGQTVLGPREIITGIRLKKNTPFTLSHYEKVGKRKAMAIAVASLAACLRLSPDGTVVSARLAWGSVGPTVVTSPEIEAAMRGQPLTPELLRGLIPAVERAVSPIDDIRATAAYRRKVAANLFLRLSGIVKGGTLI